MGRVANVTHMEIGKLRARARGGRWEAGTPPAAGRAAGRRRHRHGQEHRRLAHTNTHAHTYLAPMG
jgi:hypothetical protein